MRWIAYAILVYVALGLQVGLAPYLAIGGVRPNLILPVAVFIALNASREPALLGCFILGLVQDLMSEQPLGLFALSYGLAGIVIQGFAQLVYRDNPLTHTALSLFAAITMTVVVILNTLWRPLVPFIGLQTEAAEASRLSFYNVALSALYTVLISPFVLGVLSRMKRIFAFQPSRRDLSAW